MEFTVEKFSFRNNVLIPVICAASLVTLANSNKFTALPSELSADADAIANTTINYTRDTTSLFTRFDLERNNFMFGLIDETVSNAEVPLIPEPFTQPAMFIAPETQGTVTNSISLSEQSGIIETKPLYFSVTDVTEPSNMTLEQIEFFIDYRCKCWKGLAPMLKELDSRINLIFLFSVARAETWAGEVTVGDYNSFNIRHGSSGEYADYNSYADGITAFVNLILNAYVNPEGKWHEGTSIEAIGKHYAEAEWAPGITKLGYEIEYICSNMSYYME